MFLNHEKTSIDRFSETVSNANLDVHTADIVTILGGIDGILHDYIRISTEYENEELLTSSQMQRISDLISDSERAQTVRNDAVSHTIWDKMYRMAKLKSDIFHLSRSETLLHSIVLERHSHYVDRLVKWVFSKYALMTSMIVILPLIILGFINRGAWFSPVWLTVQIIFILYLLLCTLTCNKPVFYLVLSGFDFWIKIGYGIASAVCLMILARVWKTTGTSIEIMTADVGAITLVFIIVMVSLIEGYAVSWKLSFCLGLVMSSFASYRAIQLTLFTDKSDEVAIELSMGITFEIMAFYASSMRVLSLFLWKQTLMAAYTRGECCICIYLTPRIKWVSRNETEEKEAKNQR